MTPKYCCGHPRSDSPVLPPPLPSLKENVEPAALPENSTDGYPITDSRYTSTRTEDLRDIQRIFHGATNEEGSRTSDGSNHNSPRKSVIGSLFRKTLARTRSKSSTILLNDADQIQRTKGEIRKTLLSQQGREAGGYDSDAAVLDDVDDSLALHESGQSSHRGRGKTRLQSLKDNDWPQRNLRMSSSLSPPRISIDFDTRRLRRSFSELSLRSTQIHRSLLGLRLPLVSTNSKNWKHSVMESLQISSPSMSVLVRPDSSGKANEASPLRRNAVGGRTSTDNGFPDTAPRLSLMKGSLDRPFGAHTSRLSIEESKPVFANLFPALGIGKERSTERSPERPKISPHAPKCSVEESSYTMKNVTERPRYGKHRASAASVHLYNMRISHHLRSESSFSSAAVTTAAPTRDVSRSGGSIPLPVQLIRRQRQASKSGFATEDVPEEWGKVVNDAGSSVYSTAANSPIQSPQGSNLHLPRPSFTTVAEGKLDHADKISSTKENTLVAGAEYRPSTSDGAKTATTPPNLSSSNLSKGSRSSKKSRFKEDFESSEVKRSSKRNSLVSLFTRRPKRTSDGNGALDGTTDEPGRLQRAKALSDRQDATGLMAKAIEAQQQEKSCMYLSGHKEQAKHDLFRQRSSSFSRLSSVSGVKLSSQADIHTSATIIEERSDRDAHLVSKFSMPAFLTSSPEPLPTNRKRGHSNVGRARPEFSLGVFSSSEDSGAESTTSSQRKARQASNALDPHTVPETHSSKLPSFELNDLPTLLETEPTPSSLQRKRGSLTPALPRSSDDTELDDAHLNLGSWSRYPSHTREERTGSAGAHDLVKTRDFAYQINPESIAPDSCSSADDGPKSAKKKGTKKKARIGLPKSRSMMIGKDFIKNYTRMIRSPSVEWLSHGKGHRTSISAGGSLAHPELEVLPPVFAATPYPTQEEEDAALSPIPIHTNTIELRNLQPRKVGSPALNIPYDGASEGEAHLLIPACDPARRAASSPDLNTSQDNQIGTIAGNALALSRYYESCVNLPRNSSVSRNRGFSQRAEITGTTDSGPPASNVTGLIDAMLHSSSGDNGYTSSEDRGGCGSFHAKNKSMASAASSAPLRASSMDLLKTLAEVEEKERMRCLDLLTQRRSLEAAAANTSSTNESGKSENSAVSMELVRMSTPVVVEAN